MTGFSPAVRKIILARAGSHEGWSQSELTGVWTPTPQIHHRRPRQAGGSKRPETNQPANGIVLTPEEHDGIERGREAAYGLGLLLRQHQVPCETPVRLYGGWFLLDNDGGFERVATPTQEAG